MVYKLSRQCLVLAVWAASLLLQRIDRMFGLLQTYVVAITSTRSSADADNRLDAFSGQSRSTNMVPFHVLHIVSYCAIVTLSLRRAVFTIFVFKKFHDLEMGSKVTQGH